MLKLFISYSHPDEHYVQDFLRHTALLETNGLLSERWYDRKIAAGDDFWDRINEHLADRDIVCCFISSHYISSGACKKEFETALELRKKNGILVIPIILSPCAWLDFSSAKRLLAMPTDGKPISKYEDKDEAWMDVYSMLKNSIEAYANLKSLTFSIPHNMFIKDASLLTKAHGNKNELEMDDIYIHPDVEHKNNAGSNERMSFKTLMEDFDSGSKIAIVGEDQSGKTTLAKKAISMLRSKGFIPVYIKDETGLLQGDMDYRIESAFKEQYATDKDIKSYDKKRIIPIIDDFHKAKRKEVVIERLKGYEQLIIIVDAIYDIDLLNEKTLVEFERYTIKQLKPSLRNELIRKWINVSETEDQDPEFINGEYMQIDNRMAAVDEALGKVLGKGIMPSYPFFVLTLLSNYDSINKPLNEEITSQGYCYQALIVLFLSKQGVKNDKIDTYINFLTEFAYKRYCHKSELSQEHFNEFVKWYSEEFNLTEDKVTLIKKLKSCGILHISSLGNYDFNYPYLYYFFAGKYFSEHLDERDESNAQALADIETILDNLHKNENAYIAIFMVHHCKYKVLIGKILQRADGLFKDFEPATMTKEEMLFFRNDQMARIGLPEKSNPTEARKKDLEVQDAREENETTDLVEEDDDSASELSLELRRSMKTVEVIGRILNNRSGSLKNAQLAELFEKGMNVHLRLISQFFEIVKKMIVEPNYDQFLVDRVLEIDPKLKDEAAHERAQKIFWNINFGFIVGMIKKISTSLGSRNTIAISDSVCSQNVTPIKYIIQQDIAMRHAKNLRLDEIIGSGNLDMPDVAKNALVFSVAQFCRYNRISDKDRNKLQQYGIKKQYLLPRLGQQE